MGLSLMRRMLSGVSASSALKKFPVPVPDTPVAKAAAEGDLSFLSSARRAELLELDSVGNSALVWSSDGGSLPVTDFLIDAGVDVNVKGYLGNTALARAARHGHLDVVKRLLAVPTIDPNLCNDKLQYPLHFAAFQQHAGGESDAQFRTLRHDCAGSEG